MPYDSYTTGGFKVLRILEDLTTDSDLAEVKELIERERALKRVALVFTENSCLYSKAVKVLIDCHRALQKREGVLGITNPNSSITFVLRTVGLEGLVKVFQSEEDIAGQGLAE